MISIIVQIQVTLSNITSEFETEFRYTGWEVLQMTYYARPKMILIKLFKSWSIGLQSYQKYQKKQ